MRYSLLALTAVSIFVVSPVVRADDARPRKTFRKAALRSSRMVLCSGVQDREPGAEITTAKIGDTVIGFNQIRSGLGEVTVTHRWLHEADNMGDVPLAVKSSPWRTWSRKTVSEAGNWKWQVLDSSGAVLKVAFTVTP